MGFKKRKLRRKKKPAKVRLLDLHAIEIIQSKYVIVFCLCCLFKGYIILYYSGSSLKFNVLFIYILLNKWLNTTQHTYIHI